MGHRSSNHHLLSNDPGTPHCSGQSAAHGAALDVLEPYFFTMIWRLMKMAAPATMAPIATHLTVPSPDNNCLADALDLPVTWERDQAAMIFDANALLQPWQMCNSGIIRANEPALDNLLRGLKSADIAARVRLHLLNALHEGLPTEETIAAALHMSPRTLQRRLKAEHTTYGEVVQQTRRQLAQQLQEPLRHTTAQTTRKHDSMGDRMST